MTTITQNPHILQDLLAEISPGDLKGLRVAFINMPLRENAQPNTPPQGPALMASRLRAYGAEVSIIDLNAYRIKDEMAKANGKMPIGRHLTPAEVQALLQAHFLKYGEPDLIGISGMITTLRWQEMVTKMCRDILPDTFIVSGGGLATEIKGGLFQWIPELDAVAHSEGDDIILVIARHIKTGKDRERKKRWDMLSSSPYNAGQVNGRSRYLFGGDRPRHLDELPFAAWDLLEEDVYGNNLLEQYIATPVWGGTANNSSAAPFEMKRSLTTVSSRGCPYECAFCYRGAQGERLYGMRSAENLAREIQWLTSTYSLDFVGFPDDNFAVDRKRIAQLPAAFQKFGIRWGTHTRLDEADERLVDMAKSGCIYIGFGAESASPVVLDRMDKGGFILRRGVTRINGFDFPLTMVDGIKKCREVGIHANCTWIMGYPGETLKDLQTSIAFILWQKELYTAGIPQGTAEYTRAVESVNQKMFTATAYPGTAMFKEPSVVKHLSDSFGIQFDAENNPVMDQNFKNYVLELDDATKILKNDEGKALNFGDMPTELFVEARKLIDQNKFEEILEM